jgi:hypothetical protein
VRVHKKIGNVIASSAMTDFSWGGFSDIVVVVLLSCVVDIQRVQDTREILI